MSLTLNLDIAWMLAFIGIFTLNDLFVSPFVIDGYGDNIAFVLYWLVFVIAMIAVIYYDREIHKEKEKTD